MSSYSFLSGINNSLLPKYDSYGTFFCKWFLICLLKSQLNMSQILISNEDSMVMYTRSTQSWGTDKPNIISTERRPSFAKHVLQWKTSDFKWSFGDSHLFHVTISHHNPKLDMAKIWISDLSVENNRNQGTIRK